MNMMKNNDIDKINQAYKINEKKKTDNANNDVFCDVKIMKKIMNKKLMKIMIDFEKNSEI
jgi:hypothetical protein